MTKTFWIGGKNTVFQAINNPGRNIRSIMISKDFREINKLKIVNTKIKMVDKNYFYKIFKDKFFNHQSIAAEIEPLEQKEISSNFKNLKNIIILDNITDPRNIGSIARTALAFNIDAIVVQKRHFNSRSPLMYKSASGAMENIVFYEQVNLANTIRLLKKNNFWVSALSAKSNNEVSNIKTLDDKNAFIFGSEDRGISKNILRMCDFHLNIKISNKIESLNVSNAVAALLAIVSLKRQLI